MSKKINFISAKDGLSDEKIQHTLNARFELPELVEEAKKRSFEEIKARTGKGNKVSGKKRKIKKVYTLLAGIAAAFAVFTVVCITNPALAANIPLIGNIFKEIGNSLGFSGDYEDYAKPLKQDNINSNNAGKTEDENKNNSTHSGESAAYSKTVDGVTVTLSEVYCNNEALYLSMLIESDEPIPETELMMGSPVIDISDSDLKLSYNKGYQLLNAYLDGKLLDDHTYAGVLRIDMEETERNYEGEKRYYADRNAFLEEKGFDMEKVDVEYSLDDIARQLGMEEFSDEQIAAIGGPDIKDYNKKLEIPDKFSADLVIHSIRGRKPFGQETTPESSQELYAGASIDGNDHNRWSLRGDWEFSLNIERDYTKNVKADVNLLDEDGYGVLSITKTPFEIALEVNDPEARVRREVA